MGGVAVAVQELAGGQEPAKAKCEGKMAISQHVQLVNVGRVAVQSNENRQSPMQAPTDMPAMV